MNTKQIILATLIIIAAIGVAYLYVHNSQSTTRTVLQEQLSAQEELLRDIADITYTNREDKSIASYVRDCSSAARAEFDSKLDRLTQLSATELERAELLFEACASYFADKKSAGVARLEAAYAAYHTTIDVYSVIDQRTHSRLQTEDWELFIAFQGQLAELLHQQVPLQKDIIQLLRDGVVPSDPAIRAKVESAQEISESATVISRQTDAVYNRIK
ncbi:MAG: hypothetical protein AAFO91_05825 [Bacteroidota bacterium]